MPDDIREPQANVAPDFSALRELLADNMACVRTTRCELKDINAHVFDAALEAIYGPDVWDWHNTFNKGE